LCESNTGYLQSFIVYTGNETSLESPLTSKDTPETLTIVSELLLNKGHTFWMDNYCTSPALVKFLNLTTPILNRKVMANKLEESKLQKGVVTAQHR